MEPSRNVRQLTDKNTWLKRTTIFIWDFNDPLSLNPGAKFSNFGNVVS